MTQTDNTTRNIVLSIILGPFAGAYFGYRYAQQKQELYRLDPSAERGWDGAFTNVLVGILAGNIAAPLFGYNVAKLDMKIEDLRHQQISNNRQRQPRENAAEMSQEPERETSKWRDQMSAVAQRVEATR